MRPARFRFPADEILEHAYSIKICLEKIQGVVALRYKIEGSVGDPFDERLRNGDDEDGGCLLEVEPADPLELARTLLGILQPSGKGGVA